MAKMVRDQIRVAIDIGTTKIGVLVARHVTDELFDVIGIGVSPSHGLRKGVVVDIAKTIESIRLAIKEAELMSGVQIESACVGISGGHIRSLNSHGVVPIKKSEVRLGDIENVIAAAKAVPLAQGQQILHVLPQFFLVDGYDKVQDPLGMHGIRLEAQVHIITGSVASVHNLIKCCEAAGVTVTDVILEQLASADAVLSKDERELGVGVLDIGGGTSDLALYQHGTIRHTMVLPIAGNHFTQDVAIGLRTTIAEAERIKREYGCAELGLLDHDQPLVIQSIQGNETHLAYRSELVAILEPRARELLTLIKQEIARYHLQPFIRSGFVLTGGGSLLKGMCEMAEEIFGVPVRLGNPKSRYTLPDSLYSPIYSTAYGLLVHSVDLKTGSLGVQGPLAGRVFERMKSWVSDFF